MMNAYDIIKMLHDNTDEAIDHLHKNVLLLESKTNIDETPLHYCVIENRIDIVKKLIDIGANVNAVEMSLASPLFHAAKLEYSEMVSLLLASGADVDLKNNNHETALSECVRKNNKLIFDVVFPKCKKDIQYYFADIDAMEIAENGKSELEKFIIKLGLINPYEVK